MARDSKGQPREAKRKNDEWSEKSKNDTGGVVRIRESSKKRFEAQKGMKRFGAYEAWNQDRESLQRVVGLRTSGRVHREETRTLRGEDDRRASRQVGNEASVIVGQAKKKQQLRVEALIIITLFVSKSVLNGNDEKFKEHSKELKISFFGKERLFFLERRKQEKR